MPSTHHYTPRPDWVYHDGMCGRYTLYDTDDIEDRFKVTVSEALTPTYNAAPGQTLPVITADGLQLMRWGLIPQWAKDEKIGYQLINARSETVFDKPMWRSIITTSRCLIPANGFYEWQKQPDGKHPYYIHPTDPGLFAFAGIWTSWRHQDQTWHTYSILTTEPNQEMTSIHDRMPVILHRDDEAQWLAADTRADIELLLHPYPDNHLDLYEVSTSVNVVRNNDETLIGPINST